MTTRALEDNEIKAIFENVSGTHAKRKPKVAAAVAGSKVVEFPINR